MPKVYWYSRYQGIQGIQGVTGTTGTKGTQGQDGLFQLTYNSTSTTGDPGTGKFGLQAGWGTSTTTIRLSTTDVNGNDIENLISTGIYSLIFNNGTSIQKILSINGYGSDQTSYWEFSGGQTSSQGTGINGTNFDFNIALEGLTDPRNTRYNRYSRYTRTNW